MRYFLQENFNNELSARIRFVYDTFHLWVIPKSIKYHFTELVSIPTNCYDLCIIVGHNLLVKHFLTCFDIKEKNIAVITCDYGLNISQYTFPGKNIYIAKQNISFARLYKGKEFGFNFDLTESELLLYNIQNTKTLEERLGCCFTKIKGGSVNI